METLHYLSKIYHRKMTFVHRLAMFQLPGVSEEQPRIDGEFHPTGHVNFSTTFKQKENTLDKPSYSL